MHEVLLAQVDELLSPVTAPEEATSSFADISHDAMCMAVQRWIEDSGDVLAERPVVQITQGLQDAGADVIAEFHRAGVKIGIQVKSYRDLTQDEFTPRLKAQITESSEHGIDRLYIVLCGDHCDPSQLGKIRWWQSFISKRTDSYVRCLPGTRAWTIHSQRSPDVETLTPRFQRLRNEIETSPDAARLRTRSHEELHGIPYGAECGEDNLIHIQRTAVAEIVTAARRGHVVVHGEPGAGKSWAIRQALEQLSDVQDGEEQQAILLRVERLPAESLSQLRDELRLERDLPEVLAGMAVDGTNVLLIDGLDAARSPERAGVVRELIDAVVEQTEWQVVVSIRSFEWRHSIHFRDLLRNRDDEPLSIEVGEFDEDDIGQVVAQAPLLADLLAEDTPLRELAANPFNLQLLAGIVTEYERQGEDSSSLRTIRTQVELLREYWRHRVECGELTDAREAAVRGAAEQMLNSGELRVRSANLNPRGNEIRELLKDGVFIALDDDHNSLGFFHNVFADFAAARVLIGDVATVVDLMRDDNRVLFLRPAMRILLAYAYQCNRTEFWTLVHAISETGDLRALWRIMPAQVLVEAVPDTDDLEPLVARLCSVEDGSSPYGLRAILIAINHLRRPREEGDTSDTWLRFCHQVKGVLSPELVGLYIKYLMTWADLQRLTADQSAWLNEAARSVYVLSRQHPASLNRVGAMAVSIIACTFSAAPDESRSILREVADTLDDDACWHLALKIAAIVPHDPECVAEIMCRLFAHRETSDEQVPLGDSLVLRLMTRRADQWGSVWHQLEQSLPLLLTHSPAQGVHVVCRVADMLLQERAQSYERDVGEPEQVTSGDVVFRFQQDVSSIWYNGSEHREGREAVIGSFDDWLETTAESPSEEAVCLLRDTFDALFTENRWAVIWAICLKHASTHPNTMSRHVLPLLTSSLVLRSSDTRYQAGAAITSCYPEYPASDLGRIVDAILGTADVEGATDEQAEVYRGIRDTLLRCVPQRPADSKAASLWEDLSAREDIENRPPFSLRGEWGEVTDEMFLHESGVDTESAAYQQLERRTAPVRDFLARTRNQIPSWQDCCESFPDMRELGCYLLNSESNGTDSAQHEMARTRLAEALSRMTLCQELAEDTTKRAWARDQLLRFSNDASPVADPVRIAGFDQAPSWSPSPRAEAAEGLLRLCWLQQADDDGVLDAICRLAVDECPEVRFQVASGLWLLHDGASEVMWELCEGIAESDRSSGVLLFFMNKTLSRLVHRYTDRVLDLLITIYSRSSNLTHAMPLIKEIAEQVSCMATYLSHSEAQQMRMAWLDEDGMSPEALVATLGPLREALLLEDEHDPDRANRVRSDAIEWHLRIATFADAEVQERERQLRSSATDDNSSLLEEGRDCMRLLESVTSNIQFSVRGRDRDEDEGKPRPEAVARFFEEAEKLLETVTGLQHPALVHDVLQALGSILRSLRASDDIKRFTDLLAVACGGPDRIDLRHFESLIVNEVVRIVRILLADHRDVLSHCGDANVALLRILDAFVSVGWPEPHELVFHLEEVAR